jgi:hypothetical protein
MTLRLVFLSPIFLSCNIRAYNIEKFALAILGIDVRGPSRGFRVDLFARRHSPFSTRFQDFAPYAALQLPLLLHMLQLQPQLKPISGSKLDFRIGIIFYAII